MKFFNELQDRIREIRVSEKFFYQKIKDLYTTSIDYDAKDAKTMAQQHTPMYMKDWIDRLDAIISLNGKELLTNAGKITHQLAVEKASLEYNKYKQVINKEQKEQCLKKIEADIKNLNKKLE